MALRITRVGKGAENLGRGLSTAYADVANGLLTAPVKCGPRSSGWPEHELDAILAARIAGKTDAEIRELVKRLMAARNAPAQQALA